MKKGLIIVIAIVAVCAIWAVSSYNKLVASSENVESLWSSVETQYQRRADLIPNLVATVKGYAEHESSTLENVVAARNLNATSSEAGVKDLQAKEGAVTEALSRLMVVVERYPELKANENFRDLQAQLEGTENRIAEARRLFNEGAKKYNVSVRRFPTNIVASMFGFEKKGYFEADANSKSAPKVEF